jgi:hypothetical protein
MDVPDAEQSAASFHVLPGPPSPFDTVHSQVLGLLSAGNVLLHGATLYSGCLYQMQNHISQPVLFSTLLPHSSSLYIL